MSEDNQSSVLDIAPVMQAAAADPTEMIHRYLNAYETKDRSMLESVLSPGFVFSSPEDNYINVHAYLEKWWPHSESIAAINVEKIFVHQDEAFTQYVVALKDGRQYRNAGVLKFDAGRIAKLDAYFGRELDPMNLKKVPGMGMGM